MKSLRNVSLLALLALSAALPTTAAIAENGAATPEEVVTKVWGAAKFLQTKGVSGLAALNNPDGPWVWKDSYVFV